MRHGVLHTGRRDQHGEEEAEGVGDDAAFAARDLLARVDALAGGRNAGGGLDAPSVDHARRRLGIPPSLLPQRLPEQAVELGEHALASPSGEVAVDALVRWEVMREYAHWHPVRST
ncbi:hypothetical protein GCM10010343_13320 [Streptomyces avidinii]|nr:hypothetical protein GCM10010343_13320 [Streptomyces avidinii]